MRAATGIDDLDIPVGDELTIVANARKLGVTYAKPEVVIPSDDVFMPRVTLAQAAVKPDLDFVLPGLLKKSVGMLVGPSAVGKSLFTLGIGVSMATGKPIAGGLWDSQKIGATTILMGEDDTQILQDRLYWLRQVSGLTAEELSIADQLLTVRSTRGVDMRIIEKTPTGYQAGTFFNTLKRLCIGQRLVILDPYILLNGGDENDNNAAAVLMSLLYSITRDTGVTIIVVHHVGKTNNDREEWAAARGASAITTSVRWQVSMTPPSLKEMDKFGIDGEMRKGWVRVACVKANYGDGCTPGWLERGRGGVLGWKTEPRKDKSVEGKAGEYRKVSGGSRKQTRQGGHNGAA